MGSCNGILGKSGELTDRLDKAIKNASPILENNSELTKEPLDDIIDLPEASTRLKIEYPKDKNLFALEKINNLPLDKSKQQIESLLKLYHEGEMELKKFEDARNKLAIDKEEQTTFVSSNNELLLIKISINSNQSKNDSPHHDSRHKAEIQVVTNKLEPENLKNDAESSKDHLYKDYIDLISKRTSDMADRLDKQKEEFEHMKRNFGKAEKGERPRRSQRTKKFDDYRTYLEKKFSHTILQRHSSQEREPGYSGPPSRDLSGSLTSKTKGCLRNSMVSQDTYGHRGPPKKVHFKKQWETQY